MSNLICYCKNVTRAEIDLVIERGAKTLGEIQRLTGACTGNRCKEQNPSGKCCSEVINAMLNSNNVKNDNRCCCSM